MIDLGPSKENEMVLAFLRAEIDSVRAGQFYSAALSNLKVSRRSIIDRPDLLSVEDNQIRNVLLTLVRGYGNGTYQFQRFPANVTWRRIALDPSELCAFKYANHRDWVTLSGGTRRVVDGAANIHSIYLANGTNRNILAVVDGVKTGKKYPELIAVEGEDQTVVLIEGHTRATAYALAQLPERIEGIVGSSPIMNQWAFY